MPILVFDHGEEEGKADCFVFIVSQMSCCCKYSEALPHNALGLSAVCNCNN